MRLALVADTHIPSRAQSVPRWVSDELAAADHTIHAGDFASPEGYFELSVLAGGDLTAVRGNMDPRLDHPPVATVEAGGLRFVVTHGDGYRTEQAYRRNLVSLADEHGADVVVAGHTHRLLDDVYNGVRLLNPGSATGADPATQATMMTADCKNGSVTVTVHRPPE